MLKPIAWIAAVLLSPLLAAAAPPEMPDGLLCELLRHPETAIITNPRPHFGWIVNDPARGAVQSAYQIMVWAEPRKQDFAATLWDSGKVMSANSVDVVYDGKPLAAGRSYTWAARAWNAAGEPSQYSKPQRINIGDAGGPRAWPGESHWVQFTDPTGKEIWALENRQMMEYQYLKPAQVVKKGDGHFFIDFGRAAFATVELTLDNPQDGKVIEIHLAEKAKPDQTVDRKPAGSIVYIAQKLTLKRGKQTYRLELPRHISKMPHSQVLDAHLPEVEPWRYAEIIGSPSDIGIDDVRQYALFYPFDDSASEFVSSDADLNAVWNLCKYTMKATPFMGLYTDGTRERMPYEADAAIQQLGHYCTDREYAVARYSHEFLLYNATWPTEWILQSVMMAWADYLWTGNNESIVRNYPALKAKTLSALAREDGLISTKTGKLTKGVIDSVHYNGKELRDVVDWPQPGETDGFVFGKVNTVVNAFHFRSLVLMAKIAAAAGHPEDVKGFEEQAAKVARAINDKLFDATRGVYVDAEGIDHASLHANCFPLALGLVPADRRASVVKFIESRGMACGPYGSQYLLDGIYDAGEAVYGLSLLTSKTDRSWLNMIKSGSTMTTEAWDAKYKKNLTWNHAWGAAPANLIPRKLMGVEPLEPGFARVRIRPQPAGLKEARLKMPTVRGTIRVEWREGDLGVHLPANVVGEVYLVGQLAESDHQLAKAPDVRFLREEAGARVYQIGGGSYKFTRSMPW
jgi:alpha-L-rhamnosidase